MTPKTMPDMATTGGFILSCLKEVKCSERGCHNTVPQEWVEDAVRAGDKADEMVCPFHYYEWVKMHPQGPEEI